ncbi:ATP-grasp domain-containing protein [Micromonospora sp. DT4]|uniref:ATP-grasp domain-containing protein n=1 Tax=Micromonospora sp. DT4 TaxID=3393438 RepID=UPI003CED4719
MLADQTVLFVNTRPSPTEAEPCFDAARALGLDVVLLADRPVAGTEGLAAEVVLVNTFDFDALVIAAQKVAAERNVVGVVCWGDRDVEGVAAVARALRLPGNTPESAAIARNKAHTREALLANCPDLTPRFARVSNPEELEAALQHVPLPAVLKPVSGSTSKGIFAVDSRDAAFAALTELIAYTQKSIDPIFHFNPGQLILETRIDGSEHSIDGIVRGGVLAAAAITDKSVRPPHSLEYLQTHPTALDADTQQRVLDAAQRTVTALGLGTTAIHLELRVTEGGQPMILEMNSRTGGGYITTHLLAMSRGYGFLEQVLIAVCDLGPTMAMPPAYTVAGSRQVISAETGRLSRIDGVAAALDVPGLLTFAQDAPIGSAVAQPPSSYTSAIIGTLIARGPSLAAVTSALEVADALVTVEVEHP